MDPTDAFARSEQLMREIEQINKFGSRFQFLPYRKVAPIVSAIDTFVESLPQIDTPMTRDELYLSELRRRMFGEARGIEMRNSSRVWDPATVIDIYGIPQDDLAGLRGWLEQNRDATHDAIERLFATTDTSEYQLNLQLDMPSVLRQASEFVGTHIENYHRKIGRLLQDISNAGSFLREINAAPTTDHRSYYHPITSTLAIGIPAVCYSDEDGSLHIRERDLITLYGHEGMGHALNYVVSRASRLPYFIANGGAMTTATLESVAQHYQHQIFEDLKASPETQRTLGIQHKFDEIYRDAQDTRLVDEFRARFFQYAITVLADKRLGPGADPAAVRRRIELLSEVTIDPSLPLSYVESNKHNYDVEGNLSPSLVSELRYCAKPVDRAIAIFGAAGKPYSDNRDLVDLTLLTGFWTSHGFEDHARIAAGQGNP